MSFVTQLNGMLPFAVSVNGRKRDALLRILDPLFSLTTRADRIATVFGPILVDGRHAPQRFLSYAFFNILKYYRRSELGRYIALHDGAGKVFVDIGANLGLYSYIARLHGYATYMVEPEPMHAAFLERNAATLGRLISAALSDRNGALPLYYQDGNSGATSLVPAKGYKQGSGCVCVRTFSGLAADGAFGDPRRISLVKIDVEGEESATVAGMREFLDAGHRPAIWCEVRGDASGRAGGSYRTVVEILEAYDYAPVEYLAGEARAVELPALAARTVFDLLFEPPRS